MQRFLINGVEVDHEEFDAEFNAIIHAYFEENFETFLDESDQEIWFGNSVFYGLDVYKMLTEENQKRIYNDMFEEYIDAQWDDLDIYWEQEYNVDGVVSHFDIQEVEADIE